MNLRAITLFFLCIFFLNNTVIATGNIEYSNTINVKDKNLRSPPTAIEYASDASSVGDTSDDVSYPKLQEKNSFMGSGNRLHDNKTQGNLVKAFLGLVLIVALILALAWVAKKMSLSRYGINSMMKVRSVLALSAKDKLIVVEVADELLLLGISPSGITKLAELHGRVGLSHEREQDGEVDATDDERSAQSQGDNSTFDHLNINQKIAMLKTLAYKKRAATERSLDENKRGLSANNTSEFSRKLKEFISNGKDLK